MGISKDELMSRAVISTNKVFIVLKMAANDVIESVDTMRKI